ncbi:MAG: HlyD family efflux transporter periplasmic adaptor subunit [bacterium]|nr:HlyD family efflux transporter periplasmic adaptor subunit [bacterium]
MEKKKKLLLGGFMLVLLAGAALALAGGLGEEKLEVELAKAERGAIEDWYTEEGVLSLGRDYAILAEVQGAVREICVQKNERVEEGQLLLRLDDSDYAYELTLAQNTLAGYEAQMEAGRIQQVMSSSPQEYLQAIRQELERSEAQYRSAKTVHEGNQTLLAAGDIAKVDFEAGEAEYQAAKLAWEQAKNRYEESSRRLQELKEQGIEESSLNRRFYESELSQLSAQAEAQRTRIEQLESKIEKCEIKAERRGIVTEIPAQERSAVLLGETVVLLRQEESLKAEAELLTQVAPYIKEGTKVQLILKLRGGDESYAAVVSQKDEYAKKGTSSLGLEEYRVHVEATVEEAGALAERDGYGVDLKFLLYENEDGISVPLAAVFESGEEDFVYGIRDNRAVKIPVELAYQTATRAVLQSGLEEGETVIAQADLEGLYEGVRVRGREAE